ncbi:uncharacterized protein LOC124157657 isoform X2 [Ischnura elegans]|uniref:uncharacterized protein LOC124157657 isoform X2 n=1 Tax=Ischnura elegans TaxID=197161 RepID=UPI001ED87BBB|nr:uncharacterized protein LOC124157657 isoform X2 [Ischnura elegans]
MSLIEEKEEENNGLEESGKGPEERDERPEDRNVGLEDTDERKEERNESEAGRDDILEERYERREERNKSEIERSESKVERNISTAEKDKESGERDEIKEERNKSKEERSESNVEINVSIAESEKGIEEVDGGLEDTNEIKEERNRSQTERIESKAEKNKSKEERKEEILTVSEVGHRSQEILDSLREKHLEGLRQSNLAEGSSLTYHPEEEKITQFGTKHMSDAAQHKFGYNPKFRFKAVVRLVMTHIMWMSTSHGEEKKTDDFAFNLRLLRKKKGQLSLLSFKEIHEELAKAAVLYCFRPNREVMRKGNPPTGLYLITSGEAATLKLHLDPLTLEPSLVPTGSIIPGQIFGEAPLLFNLPRTISVITMTSCETVFWHKTFFDKFLLEAAKKKSETIRKIVSHLTSFSNWDEESLRRLSTKAYIFKHPKDSAILGESIGEKETIHLIVNGVCSIIQRLDMIHGIKDDGVSITPYPAKKGDIPPGCYLRTHFLDVAHLRKGMACNLGESWKNRVLMALNDVTILYIPYNVVEEYDARDSSWDKIAEFIQNNLPDEETLCAEYLKKVIWRDYREKFREDVIFKNKESKKSMTRHIPINITHLLEKEDIK